MQKQSPRIVTRYTTAEPEIIWSVPATHPPLKIKTKPPLLKAGAMNNDDTLIIGIVGGVVVFLAFLIIIICIVRWRLSSNSYRGGPMPMGMPPMAMGPGSVQMSYKGGPPPALYAVPPYAQSYATLPHKNMSHQQSVSNLSQVRTNYSTMGRGPQYYQQQSQQNQPYVIYSDEKGFR